MFELILAFVIVLVVVELVDMARPKSTRACQARKRKWNREFGQDDDTFSSGPPPGGP